MVDTLTMLIIDDNPDDREYYVRSLKKVLDVSYRCLETQEGKKGIEIINSRKCDCVLLDYSLPGMNGLEVLKRINSHHPFMPVILLTGQGNEAVAVEAIKHGAYDYLTKSSLNTERLHQTIKAAINHNLMKQHIAVKDAELGEKTLELALSEERYELVVQGLSVGIWDWNILTNKLYCSPKFKEIINFTDEEMEDHYNVWKSRLHPEDINRTLEILNNHLKKYGPYDVEYRLYNNGKYIWIRAKGQAVWDKNGNPVRMVGSVEDVTWRKEAEVERENIIAKLTESNSELERFAYICSHDLQEPLRMISSFTQRLEKHLGSTLDEKGVHYMKYITDGASQAHRLINDVLNYARVNHENELLTNVESEVILTSVLRDFNERIEETGAVIVHDPLPVLYMQTTHLRQILQNLIGNALKFSKETPQIYISAVREDSFWRFSLRDNGIGIAPEHMSKIFAIFQRLHSRERYPGTGIGLALCKKVVQRYGGRIWAESELGKGSTFFFTLPSTDLHKNEQT